MAELGEVERRFQDWERNDPIASQLSFEEFEQAIRKYGAGAAEGITAALVGIILGAWHIRSMAVTEDEEETASTAIFLDFQLMVNIINRLHSKADDYVNRGMYQSNPIGGE